MIVNFKKLHPNAITPGYAHDTDAGMDLTCTEIDQSESNISTYKTGLAIEIPPGYVGLLFPRSSIYKVDLALSNCVGVVDAGFFGEICFKFTASTSAIIKSVGKDNSRLIAYEVGDRIGQLIIMPYPKIEFEEVTELSNSARGTGGFGSSGK